MKTIWERYLLRETFKVFFLFLGCFFFLYALIDYSLHMQDFFTDKQIQFTHIAIYYSFQFVKRAGLLIPLALLIATLKVLFSLNLRGELVALQASGLSLKKILRPFFFVALLCASFNYLSSEFLLPSSLNFLDQFRQLHFRHSEHGHRRERIHVRPLKDRSKIIFQTEDKEKKLLFDVFWVRSVDDIWRMKYLSSDPEQPIGYYVDHLTRDETGNFVKRESFPSYRFTPFKWQSDPIGKGYIPLENRKISELFNLLNQKKRATSYEHPQILAQLLYKSAMPLLSFLVIIAGAPFCIRYARQLPIFLTYALALFGFTAFFALIDATMILGENSIISPYVAVLLPILLCFVCFGMKYRFTIGRS